MPLMDRKINKVKTQILICSKDYKKCKNLCSLWSSKSGSSKNRWKNTNLCIKAQLHLRKIIAQIKLTLNQIKDFSFPNASWIVLVSFNRKSIAEKLLGIAKMGKEFATIAITLHTKVVFYLGKEMDWGKWDLMDN